MNKKILLAAIALCASAFAHAGIVPAYDEGVFTTVEEFNGNLDLTGNAHNFQNGMVYTPLTGASAKISDEGYFLGAYSANGGIDNSKYFSTGTGPTRFEFTFASGVTRFGFHGAEALYDGDPDQDGIIDLQFYDTNGAELFNVDSNGDPMALTADSFGAFGWGDFFGFESDGAAIGRVVFTGGGAIVLDNVSFSLAPAAADVPEPGSMALFGLGLAGFAAARRKAARK